MLNCVILSVHWGQSPLQTNDLIRYDYSIAGRTSLICQEGLHALSKPSTFVQEYVMDPLAGFTSMPSKEMSLHVDLVEHCSDTSVVPTASLLHPVKFVQVMFSNVNPVAGYSAQGGTFQPAQ